MTFTQRTVSDETIFPTKYGKLAFPQRIQFAPSEGVYFNVIKKRFIQFHFNA